MMMAWTTTNQGNTIVQTGTRKAVSGKSRFTFDAVFDGSSDTQHVYDKAVSTVIHGITQGKHGTVFTYGQTSSGKTYTMQGDAADVDTAAAADIGVLQMAATDLLRWARKSKFDVTLRVSYFEIYNETVRDLLGGFEQQLTNTPKAKLTATTTTRKQQNTTHTNTHTKDPTTLPILTIRDDPKNGGPSLNCLQIGVDSLQSMMDVLRHGNRNRSVAATGMNAHSSRSHAIFRITLDSHHENVVRSATLNLVDLAGSENGNSTADTTSQRKREGGKINQSLLSLSQVIQALSLPEGKRPNYVNYRDSKLTRILQPHLSGNAQLAVICCVSPSPNCLEETRSTLRFASRAKLVQCKAQVNESIDARESALILKLQTELVKTRKALDEMSKAQKDTELASVASAQELVELKRMLHAGNERFHNMDTTKRLREDDNNNTDDIANPNTPRTTGALSDESASDDNNLVLSLPEGGKEKRLRRRTQQQQQSSSLSPISHAGYTIPTIYESERETASKQQKLKMQNLLMMMNGGSSESFPRVTRKRQQQDGGDSPTAAHPSLPSEVMVLNGSVVTGYESRFLQTTDQLSQSYAMDMENRARFLEDRLEGTEDLVESLKKEMSAARDCIQTLAHKNSKLSDKSAKLKHRVSQLEDLGQNEYQQQYYLLKYSLYASLFFFLFNCQEAFLVMSFFLWLTLERYTN
eukprot:CAMPEP_0202446210 /NCGR_PEP_ID=MMETSP1360-20130828/4786_1 /ASSEMBLY_ACC=CAM_ASM_000848 /TAXON_ID=515479 /ORGANISM="Licmophora paradoxa, Strain CCMP2313" /LENGTH=693 /DNA_ID=CAMNT_0049062653 /DNA_START=148 /DNA_END=2229 /DNA_ORIENTATION=-